MTDTRERLTVQTSETIDAFEATAWDELLSAKDYFRHGYLRLLETSRLACTFHYAGLRRGGALLGVGFGCLMRYPLGSWKPKVWLAGSPVNLGDPFALAPGETAPIHRHMLQRALFERAKSAGALFFVLRDLPAPGVAALSIAPELARWPVPLHHTAILSLPSTSFEEYLSTLSGGRRKAIQKESKAIERAGFVLRTERPAPTLAARLLELWLHLYDKYRDADQIRLTEEYFRQMIACPEAAFLTLWNGDDLVAFDMGLKLGDCFSSVFSGLDPRRCGKYPVHRFMGMAIVRQAMAMACSRIDFGISNENEKTKLGCRLELLYGYARFVPSWLHGLGLERLVRKYLATTYSPPSSAPPTAHLDSSPPAPQQRQQGNPSPAIEEPTEGRKGPSPRLPPRGATKRVVIVGAGLCGLAAAARLSTQSRTEVIVLEKTERPGGVCRTMGFGQGKDGFVAGCNLFSRRFFSLLDRYFGIRIPHRAARIATLYDGRPLAWSRCMREGFSWSELRRAASMASGYMSGASCLVGSHQSPSLIEDCALIPFLLQGQAPWLWPVRQGLAKLRAIGDTWFPLPGVGAIPQAMERALMRSGRVHIVYRSDVVKAQTDAGRWMIDTQDARWGADAVISTLSPNATSRLLGEPNEPQRPVGLSTMAAFLLLDSSYAGTKQAYSVAVIEPGIHRQLQLLFRGELPERPSFEVVSPDFLQGRPSRAGWRVTLYASCPTQEAHTAAACSMWERIQRRLEQSLPGFLDAVVWKSVMSPNEYQAVVGASSLLSPFADAPSSNKAETRSAPGLFLAYGHEGPSAGSTLLALERGWSCAGDVLETMA